MWVRYSEFCSNIKAWILDHIRAYVRGRERLLVLESAKQEETVCPRIRSELPQAYSQIYKSLSRRTPCSVSPEICPSPKFNISLQLIIPLCNILIKCFHQIRDTHTHTHEHIDISTIKICKLKKHIHEFVFKLSRKMIVCNWLRDRDKAFDIIS